MMTRNSIMAGVAGFAMLVGAGVAEAQGRGNAGRIPPGHLPAAGECRVWIDGVPPGRQPAPTSCSRARYDAQRWGGRVIYGDDYAYGNGRGKGKYKNKGRNDDRYGRRDRDDDRWDDRRRRDRDDDDRYDGRYEDRRQDPRYDPRYPSRYPTSRSGSTTPTRDPRCEDVNGNGKCDINDIIRGSRRP